MAAKRPQDLFFDVQITHRNLPHISHPGDTYFVTYRQKGTLKNVWVTEKEPVLDKNEIATIISESWFSLSERVELHAFCIMPDHVHVVLTTRENIELPAVLWCHKKFTARIINQALGWSGAFWQRENYDRILRHGKFEAAIQYTLMNPVNAEFVSGWRDWPHHFLSDELLWSMESGSI